MRNLKALLVQLPIQCHDFLYSLESFSLAQGYLAAYGRAHCRGWDIEVVPSEISHFAGDGALIGWIASERPHLVGFTCYLWNIERTLYIAERLKETIPGVIIVLGGPEITMDNGLLLESKAFDYAIVGEGEGRFAELLNSLKGRLDPRRGSHQLKEGGLFVPELLLEDLCSIPSPYIGGVIGPTFLKSIAIETARGCPFRCIYCYYHKGFASVRSFDIERIRREFMWAYDSGIEEISILDPSFDYGTNFRSVLKIMREIRHSSRMRIFCEMVAQGLDRETIHEMAIAGITDVEVGLQSTNQKALRKVGRPINMKSLADNLKAMRDEGIKVTVDIIIGLPGDDLEGVKGTLGYLLEMGNYDDVMVYPLSVLPGTELRKRAHKMGIRYQEVPPYYVLETPHMDHDAMIEAFSLCENALDMDLFPVEYPVIGVKGGEGKRKKAKGPVTHIFLQRPSKGSKGEGKMDLRSQLSSLPIAQSVTFLVKDRIPEKRWRVAMDAISEILINNPFSIVNFVFLHGPPEYLEIADIVRSSGKRKEHPLNREVYAPSGSSRSVQVFSLLKPEEKRESGGEIVDLPFLELELNDLEDPPAFLFENPVCWISVPRGLSSEDLNRFIKTLKENKRYGICDIHFWDLRIEAIWNPLCPPVEEIALTF